MSSMTMPLWRVLEIERDPYDPDDDIPAPRSGYTIGLGRYPIYDENDRLALNKLIIDHFWNRDIGQETISMFTFMLKRTMREIMPTYNQLYRSQKIDFDPLATYDLITVRNGTANAASTGTATNDQSRSDTGSSSSSTSRDQNSTANSSSSSDATGKSRSVFFDTPQVRLAGNKDYATNATDAESENESTGTNASTGSDTEQVTATGDSSDIGSTKDRGSSTSDVASRTFDTSRTSGFQGSAADLLNRFRSSIINTDMMLLNEPELTTMFLGVWDSGEQIAVPRRFSLNER